MQIISTAKPVFRERILLLVCVLVLCALFATDSWAQSSYPQAYERVYGQGITNNPEPGRWLADSESEYRSKADVMREIKQRYDARVLKITLNKKRKVYKVRLLMANGKVRNITVSARR